jgi:hypothetical protein
MKLDHGQNTTKAARKFSLTDKRSVPDTPSVAAWMVAPRPGRPKRTKGKST